MIFKWLVICILFALPERKHCIVGDGKVSAPTASFNNGKPLRRSVSEQNLSSISLPLLESPTTSGKTKQKLEPEKLTLVSRPVDSSAPQNIPSLPPKLHKYKPASMTSTGGSYPSSPEDKGSFLSVFPLSPADSWTSQSPATGYSPRETASVGSQTLSDENPSSPRTNTIFHFPSVTEATQTSDDKSESPHSGPWDHHNSNYPPAFYGPRQSVPTSRIIQIGHDAVIVEPSYGTSTQPENNSAKTSAHSTNRHYGPYGPNLSPMLPKVRYSSDRNYFVVDPRIPLNNIPPGLYVKAHSNPMSNFNSFSPNHPAMGPASTLFPTTHYNVPYSMGHFCPHCLPIHPMPAYHPEHDYYNLGQSTHTEPHYYASYGNPSPQMPTNDRPDPQHLKLTPRRNTLASVNTPPNGSSHFVETYTLDRGNGTINPTTNSQGAKSGRPVETAMGAAFPRCSTNRQVPCHPGFQENAQRPALQPLQNPTYSIRRTPSDFGSLRISLSPPSENEEPRVYESCGRADENTPLVSANLSSNSPPLPPPRAAPSQTTPTRHASHKLMKKLRHGFSKIGSN